MSRGKILLIIKLFFAAIITLFSSVSSDAADLDQLEEQRRIQQQPDACIQKERGVMEALGLPAESPC
ncbi:MAG: hypothetical protein RBT37_04575 [Dissulfurispiraceae bacterium]|jgi:hypothetical protein|nr:hypothetical protein [Dissulfurispiraceae bacterium]